MVSRQYVARWRWLVDTFAAFILAYTLGASGWRLFLVGIIAFWIANMFLPRGIRRLPDEPHDRALDAANSPTPRSWR